MKLWARGDADGASFLDAAAPLPVEPPDRYPRFPYDPLDLARARRGGVAGGLFACFVPPLGGGRRDRPASLAVVIDQIAIARRMARRSGGAVRLCERAAEIRAAMAEGALALVLHLEGADAIDPELSTLEVLHAAGLRSVGLVWQGANAFAAGATFRANATGEDGGPGLTEAGKGLVRRCDELGVLVDLSHLNAAGVRDVARVSRRPLLATHSNAHALSPSSRNLMDEQLEMIAGSGGVVGLNFGTSFLRADMSRNTDTPVETMRRHLDHLLDRLGEDGVALGSDFDGAPMPRAIGDAAGVGALLRALREAGWGREALAKLAHGNWLRVLEDAERGVRSGRPDDRAHARLRTGAATAAAPPSVGPTGR